MEVTEAKIQNFNDLPETGSIKIQLNPNDYLINLADQVPDPVPVFSINDTILCSRGNLITIKAKQKNGKTFLVSVFIAAYLTGKYLQLQGEKYLKIACMDTEQSLNQVHKITRRAHRMCNFTTLENNPYLVVYYASELDITQRWELFEILANDPETDVLIVDVATDLINDINDTVETKRTADRLQKIAKENNILIICTIHENKKDSNATGHFGGYLQKKSEAVLSLSKDEGVFTVSATDTRHGDWPDFSFRIDETGLPVPMDVPIRMTATQIKEHNIQNNLKHVLAGVRLTFTELMDKYEARDMCSHATAKRHIKTALSKDWIKIQSDNRYILTKNDNNEDF